MCQLKDIQCLPQGPLLPQHLIQSCLACSKTSELNPGMGPWEKRWARERFESHQPRVNWWTQESMSYLGMKIQRENREPTNKDGDLPIKGRRIQTTQKNQKRGEKGKRQWQSPYFWFFQMGFLKWQNDLPTIHQAVLAKCLFCKLTKWTSCRTGRA